MSAHSRAFSFVDRISSFEPGARIRGNFTLPSQVADFPPSLVAEAVGQLAAWSAMAGLDFQRRPVAGIAGCVEFLGSISPGQELELSAEIESVDAEAVSYNALACCGSNPILRLQNCVGPMVAIEEFDSPDDLRERFAMLCACAGVSNGFQAVPSVAPHNIVRNPGVSITGQIQVPESAPFFSDHFPRRPVFPGTLLMHANLQLVSAFLDELPPPSKCARWEPRTVRDVKLRAFLPPGELLESEAKLMEGPADAPVIALETRKGKRTIGTARVLLSPQTP